ncbi:MAG: glycoside hydrolase family 15 protein [Candidatus Peribacteraceae bacterium]|nr:glycoside hydrolase family 15 protein [Candidatus Peribacteraceae bacterium]
MPRSLVIGNGTLLATFDESLQMRDFYFPFVGMEDQTTYGHLHRVGIFVKDRGFSWLNDGSWKITPRYDRESLVGNSILENEGLGLSLTILDYVHPVHNVLLRHFFLRSRDGKAKEARIFFNHDFFLYGDKQKDTAFYEPYTNSVIHFRQTRYVLVGGTPDVTRPPAQAPWKGERYASILRSRETLATGGLSSFTVGKSHFRGLEGTWKDAEDGELSGNPIEQGSVDSTVGLHCAVPATGETQAVLWVCVGKSLDEVMKLQETVIRETPERLHRNCHNYWKSWVNKTAWNFGSLGADLVDLFKRSLLIIRTHVDHNGGVVAAADADIMAFNRDTYTYVWPRDGAFVSLALDRAGYGEVTRKFFQFCADIQMPDGYLLHKYNPDGSVGSSWHPWFKDGEPQLPIQEDETALVIHAIWKHFERQQDFEFLQEMYEHFVKKAAQFLYEFREEQTGLPLASYDPWEEKRGIFTYTTACTVAGLHAAARIAGILGHHTHADRFQEAADKMRQALLFHLFDEQEQRFVKSIRRKDGQTVSKDLAPDASIVAVWLLDILPPNDPRVVSTMRQLERALTVKIGIGGLARYPDDHYQEVIPTTIGMPGNPWIITTLWLAQWKIAIAQKPEDLAAPKEALQWAAKRASGTGILAEQYHPLTGAPLSVAPLTWSHSTYVDTVLRYLEKEQELLQKKQ